MEQENLMNDEETDDVEMSDAELDAELDALADAGEKTLRFVRLPSLCPEEIAIWRCLNSEIDKIARLRIDHQIRDVAEVGAEIGITHLTKMLILRTVLEFKPDETLTADEATLWEGYF